jgi:hypothetical protein
MSLRVAQLATSREWLSSMGPVITILDDVTVPIDRTVPFGVETNVTSAATGRASYAINTTWLLGIGHAGSVTQDATCALASRQSSAHIPQTIPNQ